MNYTKYLLIALTATSCWQLNGMVSLAAGGIKLLQCIPGIPEHLWQHGVNKIDLSCLEGQQTWLNHLIGALRNLDENHIDYLMRYAAAFYERTGKVKTTIYAKTPYEKGSREEIRFFDTYGYNALMFQAIKTALKNNIDANYIAHYFADSSDNARIILYRMIDSSYYNFIKNDPDSVAAGKFLIDRAGSNSDWIENLIATKNPNAWLQEVGAYAKSKRNS